jgi:hypothetical protein
MRKINTELAIQLLTRLGMLGRRDLGDVEDFIERFREGVAVELDDVGGYAQAARQAYASLMRDRDHYRGQQESPLKEIVSRVIRQVIG